MYTWISTKNRHIFSRRHFASTFLANKRDLWRTHAQWKIRTGWITWPKDCLNTGLSNSNLSVPLGCLRQCKVKLWGLEATQKQLKCYNTSHVIWTLCTFTWQVISGPQGPTFSYIVWVKFISCLEILLRFWICRDTPSSPQSCLRRQQ